MEPLGGLKIEQFPYHRAVLDLAEEQDALPAAYELGLMANMSAELSAEYTMANKFGCSPWNPYLDGRFPEQIAAIPLELRTKGWKKKYLLYKAAHGLVPDVCRTRPKSGCPAPLVRWLADKTSLGPYLDLPLASGSICRKMLERRLVEQVIERFRRCPTAADAEIIWVLVNLERWGELVSRNQGSTLSCKGAIIRADS